MVLDLHHFRFLLCSIAKYVFNEQSVYFHKVNSKTFIKVKRFYLNSHTNTL